MANIYRFKVDKIIVPNNTYCMLPKNKMFCCQFSYFNFQMILKHKQTCYLI